MCEFYVCAFFVLLISVCLLYWFVFVFSNIRERYWCCLRVCVCVCVCVYIRYFDFAYIIWFYIKVRANAALKIEFFKNGQKQRVKIIERHWHPIGNHWIFEVKRKLVQAKWVVELPKFNSTPFNSIQFNDSIWTNFFCFFNWI